MCHNLTTMNSKKTLVFIHGWGLSSEILEIVLLLSCKTISCLSFGLARFGKTPIEKPMMLADYANFVYEFLKNNNIEKPVIIGHSFGGAVAAKLTILYPESVSKLILVSASAVRQPSFKTKTIRKISRLIGSLLPKKIKKSILKIMNLENSDYAAIQNPYLKQTFINIINENLAAELPKIKIPTLIVWGEKDSATPLKEGELIAKSIPGVKFKVIKNAGHFVFLEKPEEFIKLIREFCLEIKN